MARELRYPCRPMRHAPAPCAAQPAATAERLETRTLMSAYTVTGLGGGTGTVTRAAGGEFRATTLRAAVAAANARPGADTIRFAVAGTIALDTPLPKLKGTITIAGPGAGSLTVRRDPAASIYDFSVLTIAAKATATVRGLTLAGGSADDGGGVRNAGTLALDDSALADNHATGGGGVYNAGGTLSATNCTFVRNGATGGGGICNDAGTVTVVDCTFADNTAGGGGGIDTDGGSVSVARCTFAGNDATSGAGIGVSAGTVRVADSTFADNRATGGGGLSVEGGDVWVLRCLFAGNSATGGGGVSVGSGALSMADCTVAGNAATAGGGVYNGEAAVTLTNCTFADNVASHGSAIDSLTNPYGGRTTLRNTIVAGTYYAEQVEGALDPAGAYNLFTGPAAGGLADGANHNRVGVRYEDLHLSALSDRGGPTRTIALLPGSVAIDAGLTALTVGPIWEPLTTDQRGPGFARRLGPTVDVGAYEAVASGAVLGRAFDDRNGNRSADPGEPGLAGRVVFADLNRDGRLNHDEPRAVTDAAGRYRLPGLPAGPVLVRLEPRAGWRQTAPANGGARAPTVPGGLATDDWDFGLTRTAGAV